MQWWEEKAYAREEGWAEGREEGLAAGREEGLAAGREEGLAAGREEGLAAGREEGLKQGEFSLLVQQVCRKLAKGFSPAQIADHLETDISQVLKICEIASSYAPDYDAAEIITKLLK